MADPRPIMTVGAPTLGKRTRPVMGRLRLPYRSQPAGFFCASAAWSCCENERRRLTRGSEATWTQPRLCRGCWLGLQSTLGTESRRNDVLRGCTVREVKRHTISIRSQVPAVQGVRQAKNWVVGCAFAAIFIATLAPPACAQIAALDKGNQFFVNNGLQIWGLDSDSANYSLDYSELSAGNMTGVMYSYGQSNPGTLSAGQKWSKWIQPLQNQGNYTSPANSLNATEAAHASDLLAIQVGDEQQSDMEDPNGYTKAWFDTAHASNLYTNQLLYTNSFFINNGTNYSNFIGNANPDAISWDSYPFSNPNGYYIQPTNWLSLANIFRRYALGSYIGVTDNSTRPYGMYVQTYHDSFA